jgi:hypothetical protein
VQRLKKLSNTLAALTRNAKRRDEVSFATAIAEWEDDLAFLKHQYYFELSHFGWPTTDLDALDSFDWPLCGAQARVCLNPTPFENAR